VKCSDGEPESREGPVAALDSSSIERLAGLLAPLSALSPLPLAQAAPDERELAALRDEQARQAEEIDALRREMAGLRETLAAVQTLALAEPAALPSATPAEQASPGVWATLREQWVWLAGLALALLLAAMVITRKRRERRWEPAPLVETPRAPVAPASPRPTPPAGVKAPPPRTEPAVGAAPASVPVPVPVREPSAARAAPAPVEKRPAPTPPEASVPASDQAARLALAERTPASREAPAKAAAWWDEQADTAMASTEDAPPAPLAEEPEQPLAPKPARDAADYTIDYQPPAHAKTDASAAPALERDEPSSPADSPEWEIEEVAFKPRRRDNN
ncbi:hypothetical protein BIS12_13885, partial [Halomonas sp. 707D7]|nr:hypothetical protein [Halomonas sp. 707D7]